MSAYLENLENSVKKNDIPNIEKLLENPEDNEVKLVDSNLINKLLKSEDDHILELVTEIVAEWAKTEHNRKVLAEKQVIDSLVALLNSEEKILLNVVRGLGNICYENETATEILGDEGFDKILSTFSTCENEENILLLEKISGVVLNIFISKQNIQLNESDKALKTVLSILQNRKISNNLFCLYSYLLQIVYTLMIEHEDMITYADKLYREAIKVFEHTDRPELELICLQIFYNASEKDQYRLLLANSNICQKVFKLIEQYKDLIDDEESRSVLKMACDLVNNILIEDESMKLLYDNGKGEVYKNCVNLLDSNDEDLLATAIMAIGNFARNDKNCIQIVQEGISKKLIDLIPKYTIKTSEMKILIVLLSTLKNLVVPPENKSVILEQGFLKTIKPVLEIDHDVIIFKLLGTLRLIIDKQEDATRQVISIESFLEKLVKWFETTFHLSVKREISRLLVWLIKNCKSSELMLKILQTKGALNCITSMFSSEELVMENEALIALNLLAATEGASPTFENQLLEVEIAKLIPFQRIISNDKLTENLSHLLRRIMVSEDIINHFKKEKIAENLKEQTKTSDLDQIQKILALLKV